MLKQNTCFNVPIRVLLKHYNWYSAPHKYVRQQLYEFMEKLGKVNFNDPRSIATIKNDFANLKVLLEGHAGHEDSAYHPLLKKDNHLFEQAEREHKQLCEQFEELEKLLNAISLNEVDSEKRIISSHQFYLGFSSYFSEYMKHLSQEETVLMSAMRELHGVDGLRKAVTFKTYHHMTREQMVGMMEHLSPTLNIQEKAILLLDIYDSDRYHQEKEPGYEAKFPFVWRKISETTIFSKDEIQFLTDSFFN